MSIVVNGAIGTIGAIDSPNYCELSIAITLHIVFRIKLCFPPAILIIAHVQHCTSCAGIGWCRGKHVMFTFQCLDQLIVSDEEVIEDAKFINDRFCAYHPALRIGHLPYITRVLQSSVYL